MSLQMDAWESRLLSQAYAPLAERRRQDVQMGVSRTQQRDAYRTCQELTRQHSRTFFIASALLPAEQRRAMRALYAFCRVSDDLVDEGGSDGAARLQDWRRRSLSSHPMSDEPVVLAWADARARYAIPRQYAEQLLDGIGSDLKPARYQSFAELAQYCYAVASTVGLMSIHIVGYAGHEAIPYAVRLGVALQLTNILRDIGEDWRNGRLYLPLEELAAFGLSEAEIDNGVIDERWRAFMRFQIARARRLYEQALPGIALLERSGRLAIGAAAELYRAILDDIEAHDYDVFRRRAFVSDRKKLMLLPGIWLRARSSAGQWARAGAESGDLLKQAGEVKQR